MSCSSEIQEETNANVVLIIELFLPSYANEYGDSDLEHRPDPVQDIVLTDEEAAAIMPH